MGVEIYIKKRDFDPHRSLFSYHPPLMNAGKCDFFAEKVSGNVIYCL